MFFITGKATYTLYVPCATKPHQARHTGALSRALALAFSYLVRAGAVRQPRGTSDRKSCCPKWDHTPKRSRPAAWTPLHRAWSLPTIQKVAAGPLQPQQAAGMLQCQTQGTVPDGLQQTDCITLRWWYREQCCQSEDMPKNSPITEQTNHHNRVLRCQPCIKASFVCAMISSMIIWMVLQVSIKGNALISAGYRVKSLQGTRFRSG